LTRPPDPAGRPDLEFTPEPGDELSLRMDRSLKSWPTFSDQFHDRRPNAHLGASPLLPAHLEKALRGEAGDALALQAGMHSGKWTDGFMAYDFSTGLLQVKIPGSD
jgi:hypothetical protein